MKGTTRISEEQYRLTEKSMGDIFREEYLRNAVNQKLLCLTILKYKVLKKKKKKNYENQK